MICFDCKNEVDESKFNKFWRCEICECGKTFREGMIDRLLYPLFTLMLCILVSFFICWMLYLFFQNFMEFSWWRIVAGGILLLLFVGGVAPSLYTLLVRQINWLRWGFLKYGMNKEEVKQILGEPSIVDHVKWEGFKSGCGAIFFSSEHKVIGISEPKVPSDSDLD
tara:strand:- start:300 stop:797 length:498 start_codon:yes stop_codon:yes gene_type:complete